MKKEYNDILSKIDKNSSAIDELRALLDENVVEILKTNKKISTLSTNYDKLNSTLSSLQKSIDSFTDELSKSRKSNSKSAEQTNINLAALTKGIDYSYRNIMQEIARNSIPLNRPIGRYIRGIGALDTLIKNFEFETVLDIGCGEGVHSDEFVRYGKKVTAIDYGDSVYFRKNASIITPIVADFNTYDFEEQYDCVWCSHVLEHQLNVNTFLKKVFSITKDGGLVAISVPPAKDLIVGGHVSLWNAGILAYNLILAGFDCHDAIVLQSDYDLSIIVQKKNIPEDILGSISYDSGDIRKLREFFPSCIEFMHERQDDTFDGRVLKTVLVNSFDSTCKAEAQNLGTFFPSKYIDITLSIPQGAENMTDSQNSLITKYSEGIDDVCTNMSLLNIKDYLSKIPMSTSILFRGYFDPFYNPDAVDILEYTVSSGYKCSLYTDLSHATKLQVERLREFKFRSFIISLPTESEEVTDALQKQCANIEYFDSMNLDNVFYICESTPCSLLPQEIIEKVTTALNRRSDLAATSVFNIPFEENAPIERTCLLPDGRIYQHRDADLENTIGSLKETSYKDILGLLN